MIRRCIDADFDTIETVINEATRAYRGVIPADCWHEPYLTRPDLIAEITAGVNFWGLDESGALIGVTGLQKVRDVTVIRRAYVRPAHQGRPNRRGANDDDCSDECKVASTTNGVTISVRTLIARMLKAFLAAVALAALILLLSVGSLSAQTESASISGTIINSNPKCCCGGPMRKPYVKPTVTQLEATAEIAAIFKI